MTETIDQCLYAEGKRDGAAGSSCNSGDPSYRSGWEAGRLDYRATSEPQTTVTIPSRDFRLDDPKAVHLWDFLREVIDQARADLGDEMAFSIVLSRVGRELRRAVGPDEAAIVLHQIADQQREIVAFDVQE